MNISSTQKPVVLDAGDGIKRSVPVVKNSEVQSVSSSAEISGAAAEADAPVAREQIEKAVSTLQEFAQSVKRDLNFSVDDGSGQVVVKVTDSSSGDIIRQIPSEEALQLAENLSEVRSLLFKAEA
jgi:flagellar protein FlaG